MFEVSVEVVEKLMACIEIDRAIDKLYELNHVLYAGKQEVSEAIEFLYGKRDSITGETYARPICVLAELVFLGMIDKALPQRRLSFASKSKLRGELVSLYEDPSEQIYARNRFDIVDMLVQGCRAEYDRASEGEQAFVGTLFQPPGENSVFPSTVLADIDDDTDGMPVWFIVMLLDEPVRAFILDRVHNAKPVGRPYASFETRALAYITVCNCV